MSSSLDTPFNTTLIKSSRRLGEALHRGVGDAVGASVGETTGAGVGSSVGIFKMENVLEATIQNEGRMNEQAQSQNQGI
jgi:hypothetical protein